MKRRFQQKKRKVPGLNTASLPDLIFTVLFFFMIVTHLRSVPVKVKYQTPQGTELKKLTKKSTTTYVFIGQPNDDAETTENSPYVIQVNDKLAESNTITSYLTDERNAMQAADAERMTVSLIADKSVPMGIVTDVKQAMRRANVLKINYAATQKP